MSLTEAFSVLAQVAVIVRLWAIRPGYWAFLALMAFSVFFHAAGLLVGDIRSKAYQQFWSASVFILVALQLRATLELLRRWIAEYPGLRLPLLLSGGLAAFATGGAFLAFWPSPFHPVYAARLFQQAGGSGLALYLVFVCGVLRLMYPAARPNLRKHAVLFTCAMVVSALATWIGPDANWWLSPALVIIYLGYLTLTPAGEIPPARSGDGDPEQAFHDLKATARRIQTPQFSPGRQD